MCIRDRWNRPAAGWESHAIPASVLETCPAYSEGKAACRAALAVAGTQHERPITLTQVMKSLITQSHLFARGDKPRWVRRSICRMKGGEIFKVGETARAAQG